MTNLIKLPTAIDHDFVQLYSLLTSMGLTHKEIQTVIACIADCLQEDN